MYKYTRQEAADLLQISTRSIDRYVKSWKLRAKKDWKIVYINTEDLNNLNSSGVVKQEVILEKSEKVKTIPINATELKIHTKKDDTKLEDIYADLRDEIRKKDDVIRELSMRVWRAEEIAKNSVSLIDYKKWQFLLEEAKSNLNQIVVDLENEKKDLEKDLKYQKVNNIIMLIALIVLFSIAGTLFLLKI